MSQQKSNKTLINWDLVSVNPNDKNWDWKDLFCFWGVNIQSIIGFSLVASLYLIYDLNALVANDVDRDESRLSGCRRQKGELLK